MVERVIGYIPIEKEVITSRPVEWDGKGLNGLRDLKPLKSKRTLLRPIYESVGTKINTTVDSDISGMKELPTWGSNTDDATGKHKKK